MEASVWWNHDHIYNIPGLLMIVKIKRSSPLWVCVRFHLEHGSVVKSIWMSCCLRPAIWLGLRPDDEIHLDRPVEFDHGACTLQSVCCRRPGKQQKIEWNEIKREQSSHFDWTGGAGFLFSLFLFLVFISTYMFMIRDSLKRCIKPDR